jgi:HK97 family phage prohead protease
MPGPAESEWVTRFLPLRSAQVDVTGDRVLSGYAIVFNARSQDLGGFTEVIAPSAVDRTIRSGANVDALVDHRRETSTILGSTDSGLLKQRKDASKGLYIEVRPPDTAAARDLLTVVKAGLVKGMSFAFRVVAGGQVWDEEADGGLLRTITDMEYSEVSFVVNPAYLGTSVNARNAELDQRALEEFRVSRGWRPSLAFRERALRAAR